MYYNKVKENRKGDVFVKNLKYKLCFAAVISMFLMSGCQESSGITITDDFGKSVSANTTTVLTTQIPPESSTGEESGVATTTENEIFGEENSVSSTQNTVVTEENTPPTTTTTAQKDTGVSENKKTTTTAPKKPAVVTTTTTKKANTTTTTKPAVVTTTTTKKANTTTTTKKATTTTTTWLMTSTSAWTATITTPEKPNGDGVTTTTKKVTTTTKKVTTTTKVTSTKDFPYSNSTYEFMNEVVRLCNIERANEGLSPLTLDATLTKGAMIRADEIVTSFSHTRPNGDSCFTVLKDVGASYWYAGENIAAGQTTPKAVVSSWMNSEGHRANILSENFNKIGIGYVYSSGDLYGHYWVQVFTG